MNLIVNKNASPKVINVEKAKSKGRRILIQFLCKNIREKLKWKGLSFSAPKQKRYEFWLFHHQMTDSYVQKENVYKRVQGTDHHQPHSSVRWTWCYLVLVAPNRNRRAFGLHSSSNFPSIPILLYFLPLNKKTKSLAGGPFTHINTLATNRFIGLCQEKYLYFTTTWKALVNFTFILNGLYYIYLNNKLHNVLWWRDLFPPHCRKILITKEK